MNINRNRVMSENLSEKRELEPMPEPNITNLHLPQDLQHHTFNYGVHEIGEAIKAASQAPKTRELYPSGLKRGIIQKVYVNLSWVDFDDPYRTGNEYAYIKIPSIAQAYYHDIRILYDGCPFVFWMPFITMNNMLMMGARIELHRFVSKNPNQWVEIHFVKRTERNYELLFFGLSTYLGCEDDELNRPVHKFTTERIVFQSPKYTEKERDSKKKLNKLH